MEERKDNKPRMRYNELGTHYSTDQGGNGHRRGNSPEDYLQVFKHFGVSCVVRLNEPKYDKTKFTKAGINHADLFFIDGSVPPDVSQNQIMLTLLIHSLL